MSRNLKILIAALLAVTCFVAVIHMNQQEAVSCMVIRCAGRELPVDWEELNRTSFSGELVDGKGTVTAHTYTGVLLKDLLASRNISSTEISALKVTSADNYTVEFSAEEICADDKVYVAVTVDGEPVEGIDSGTDGVQIIVFGDPNSRRCVRYAVILEIIS